VRPLDIVTDEPKMAPLWQQHYAEYMRLPPVAIPAPVS
jgi:hypothetical protein